MERPIGEIFKYGDMNLMVASAKDNEYTCLGCLFSGGKHSDCICDNHFITGLCGKGGRKDHTNVIFVKSNLPEVSDLPAPPEAEVPAEPDTRSYNVGASDYSKHAIQPWDIWNEYKLNPYDADITKRTLRKKTEPGMTWAESRILDYKKIIHICQERIRQLESGEDPFGKEE